MKRFEDIVQTWAMTEAVNTYSEHEALSDMALLKEERASGSCFSSPSTVSANALGTSPCVVVGGV